MDKKIAIYMLIALCSLIVMPSLSKAGPDITINPENDPPVASFTWSVYEKKVTFTDQSTDNSGVIVNWTWNFGDGNTSYTQNPVHNYSSTGNYTVSLNVTDEFGAYNETSNQVNVTHVLEIDLYLKDKEETWLWFNWTTHNTSKINETHIWLENASSNETIENITGEQNGSYKFLGLTQDTTYRVYVSKTDEENVTTTVNMTATTEGGGFEGIIRINESQGVLIHFFLIIVIIGLVCMVTGIKWNSIYLASIAFLSWVSCLAASLYLEIPYQLSVGNNIVIGFHGIPSTIGWYFVFLMMGQVFHLYYLIMEKRGEESI